jgi:Glycosyl hydrolase family 63 C-terminal domain
MDPESRRLLDDDQRVANWKRWGPYLPERQWGTVREDYSADGSCWTYFPHEHARSRAYRWGEDGLLGLCDRECRLCFATALWNGRDPILKERLFGLTNPQGNHGEDAKEAWFHLDATPTHSYMKALYKYPQREFPYQHLVDENARRGIAQPEYELVDTGVFDEDRYFDVFVEYAKADGDDTLIRLTAANRGPEAATLHLLPTLWFRNTWSWGSTAEGYGEKGSLTQISRDAIMAVYSTLGRFILSIEPASDGTAPLLLFTENETNFARLYHGPNASPYVKDAFHDYVIQDRADAVNPARVGTKAAAHYRLTIPAGGEVSVRLRLASIGGRDADASDLRRDAFGASFDRIFRQRQREADEFYAQHLPPHLDDQARAVARGAYAGLLWSKQFYHYVVEDWLKGDQIAPPPSRRQGRNSEWSHLFNRDVISMPDKWEYPWYASWDHAFHMIPFARIDPYFTKRRLLLMLREWYMHPNGQLPAYEFNFSDVNPPVHAWACWRVYKLTGPRGGRDRAFLERAFQKLIINFTWWVNRKDLRGKNLFGGGFLGLDNIGVFDRSRPLPNGWLLEQADGTAWMAFYCATMLAIALELAPENPVYEDLASKFFEHFVAIIDAMNTLGGTGLWDQQDGFYYDQLHIDGETLRLKIRSLVGLLPIIAAEVIDEDLVLRLPGFKKRMDWFLKYRGDLARHVSYLCRLEMQGKCHLLLAIPSEDRLRRVLRYMLDESEFLSPHGIRSLSRFYADHPYVVHARGGQTYRIDYSPGESTSGLFGGNSNWRGPIWFPVNYLLIEALERYDHFYGPDFTIECPTGSGVMLSLAQVAQELRRRLSTLFLRDASGQRPCHGGDARFATDPHWRDLHLFHEYFHGDTGRGCGADHQTGWTALIAMCLEKLGGHPSDAMRGQTPSSP